MMGLEKAWCVILLAMSFGVAAQAPQSKDAVPSKPRTTDKRGILEPRIAAETVTVVRSPDEVQAERKFQAAQVAIGRDATAALKHLSWDSRVNLLLTAGIAVLGLVQIFVFLRQLRLMRESLLPAESAARAALETAKAMAAAERAYIKISHKRPGVVLDEGYKSVRVDFEIKNFGRTPGRVTGVVLEVQVLPFLSELPEQPDYRKQSTAGSFGAFLVSGESFTSVQNFDLGGQSLGEIEDEDVRLWVYGYVDYIDQFGLRHRAGYGRRYMPELDERSHFRTEAEFQNRSNLVFVDKHGYNYDRLRTEEEGNDWPSGSRA
jgi:hypothetical protein